MRFPFSNQRLVIRSFVLVFAFGVLASIAIASYLGQQKDFNAYYEKDGNWVLDTYEKGRLVERTERKNGKLRKRTTYTYLNGFKDPNTSTTNYGPDGTTPEKTTNVDHDKDGNPTVTTTTDYDKDGKEIGGTKRERDPKTGKERCYKWDPKKQEYEEVPCPESVTQTTQPKPSPSPEGKNKSEEKKSSSENARVETGGGLHTVIFDMPPGQVRVYLPDDMRAGDTISGTVVAEPKGQTAEERAKNMAVLKGCVIEVQPPKNPDGTSNPKVKVEITAPNQYQVRVTLPPGSPSTPPLTNVSSANSSGLGITLTNTSGSFTVGGTTTVPIEMVSLSLQSVAPLTVPQLPAIGQQGRPIEIYGPFDGNSSNTKLMYGPAGSSIQDFEKNTENVTGGFGLLQPLAESPRKCVLQAPTNVTGPIELYLKEGNKETKGTFRNVGVNLTALKTSLIHGESTELHVEVTGLQGLRQPLPLTITCNGVITMEGGMYQPLVIQPSQVGADGRYTTTRGITGVQTGAWGATATVVTHKFDFCLQDDSNPQTVILWNSFTGDYLFTPPGGTSLSGQGTVTRKGCIITLTDSPPDRRVQSNVDPCTKTGSASVQISPPNSAKVKFTIVDKDMTNNTCACGPGCK